MQYYLYILYSTSANKYYVGYTDNVERRIVEHNNSERTTYTSKHRPWISKKYISLGCDRSFAVRIEKSIKNAKSRIIIERIISEINSLRDLAQLVIPKKCETTRRD